MKTGVLLVELSGTDSRKKNKYRPQQRGFHDFHRKTGEKGRKIMMLAVQDHLRKRNVKFLGVHMPNGSLNSVSND
ncbi:hypothetical protein F2P45_32465 [Massilia sp. CCM 8733]|uniref:Transposase n=1 Tax=Massilia mucilaginosa TaxID=2609282 RepID=A0ABX0P2Z1_9BURK|nr:hypothetical protein [Massilia mucilaginosa]NHZ93678.1 hypothetical protein [Massilia mucilaginosa]